MDDLLAIVIARTVTKELRHLPVHETDDRTCWRDLLRAVVVRSFD